MFFQSMTRSDGMGPAAIEVTAAFGSEDIDDSAVIEDIEGPDEAVAEPVGRDSELDRHERSVVPVCGLVVASG